MLEVISFYFFSTILIALFAISVLSKNILHAMSSLAGGMICISAIFFILNSEFLGVVQLIVYTGAIMVLYAFAIVLFDSSKNIKQINKKTTYIIFIASLIILLIMAISNPSIYVNTEFDNILDGFDNTSNIGLAIFTRYLIAFEIIAIMLLVAMVCAIVLANNQEKRQS